MTSIFDDIKQAFSSQHNSSVKIILANVFIFFSVGLFKFMLNLSPATREVVALVEQNLLLNATLDGFLNHPWGFLTYGFMNDGFMQLLFNCITLFYFGLLIQDFLGTRKLMSVYITGYVFAAFFYLFMHTLVNTTNLQLNMSPLVAGATAAVYAVMFASIALLPDYEFYFFRLFYIKIKYVVVALLVMSFVFDKGYAFLNLGGAIYGYLYIKLLRTGIDLGSPAEAFIGWVSRGIEPKMPTSRKPPKTKQYSHSTVGRTGKSSYDYSSELPDLPDQAEVDALLDKISQKGYQSLSKEEKQRLYKASQSDELRT